jgi:hypothetical protein
LSCPYVQLLEKSFKINTTQIAKNANFAKLQSIQNSLARVVTHKYPHITTHITPSLKSLHWLPVQYCYMLLLNYGTAFQLSYEQLLLFIPLDTDLKHIFLLRLFHHSILFAQFYFFYADSFWTLIFYF